MIIQSPTTSKAAEVNDKFRLKVDSSSEREYTTISKEEGDVYTANSHDASAAAGTYIFYFKNDNSEKNFHLDLLWVSAVESALWKVWYVTGTAAGGNALTPTNMNKTSGRVASATCRGDDSITGLSAEGEISTRRTVATGGISITYDGSLILGLNDAVAVEYDTGTTGIAEVFMRGYYS